jgi:hypothetical protein
MLVIWLGPMAGSRLYKIAHCNLLRSEIRLPYSKEHTSGRAGQKTIVNKSPLRKWGQLTAESQNGAENVARRDVAQSSEMRISAVATATCGTDLF